LLASTVLVVNSFGGIILTETRLSAEDGRIVETFLLESWMEHLRQHERITNADRVFQDTVNRFNIGGTPKVTHLIAVESNRTVAAPAHTADREARN
jgi:hypothetical protein